MTVKERGAAENAATRPDALMTRLLCPQSIALVGAGTRPGNFGKVILDNLTAMEFPGTLYPVNPHYQELFGRPCYPDLGSLPEAADLAVICVPAQAVLDTVRLGADHGMRCYSAITSGFGELGPEGRAMEQALAALARERNLKVMGPNCMGHINFHGRVNASITTMFGNAPSLPGQVAMVSQSGGVGSTFYSVAAEKGVGFSHIISSGNEAVLDFADYLEYLISDPATSIICAYTEQLRQGRRLLDLTQRASVAGKSVVVLSCARQATGKRAAASHTGAMAADDAVCSALFKQAGIIKVQTLEEMAAVCQILLAPQPVPSGRKVAIAGLSGGPGVLAADLADEHGVAVPPLAEDTVRRLRSELPEVAWTSVNPFDMTGALYYRADLFAQALRDLSSDPNIDVVVLLASHSHAISRRAAEAAALALQHSTKLAVVYWAAGGPQIQDLFTRAGVPCFTDLKLLFHTLDLVLPRREPAGVPVQLRSGPGHALARARVLTEEAVKAGLRQYGLPVPEETLVHSGAQAVTASAALGYPVVLKVVSPQIPHRARVGGVIGGLHSAQAVHQAYDTLCSRVAERAPEARLSGILVQRMVPPGSELFLGMARDRSFGPILAFGLGGVLAEALGQVTFRMLPLSRAEAEELIAEPAPVRTLLAQNPGLHAALTDLVLAVSKWCEAQGEQLLELDLNPIIVHDGRPVIVDALAVLEAEPPPTL